MTILTILKIITRSWWRNKVFFFISIVSLAIGLACTNLLFTYYVHDYNIESGNRDKNRIFCLRQDNPMQDGSKVAYADANIPPMLKEKYAEVDTVLKVVKQNRLDIREINRRMEKSYQKLGIVKYDAFNEMGGKLSFAIAMLDNRDNGWIINAMHSREGCYTYVKEIVKGESYVELSEEEAEALDKAIFQEYTSEAQN